MAHPGAGAGLGLGMGTFFLVAILGSNKAGGALAIPALFLVAGVLSLLVNIVTSGRWADQTEAQMEEIAGRVKELLEDPGEG